MARTILSKRQLTFIWTQIRQQHLEEMKEMLVSQFTNGKTVHIKEMSYYEARDLINHLVKTDAATRMRQKVYAIAMKMGWLMPGMKEYNEAVLDKFLLERGAVKKRLAQMDKADLVKVVTQFDMIKEHDQHQDFKDKLKDDLAELGISMSKPKTQKNS